jgi:hypothetical protein
MALHGDVDQVAVNTIRTLAIDAIQTAKSGHPGTVLGAAPAAYVLWQHFLRSDPADPGCEGLGYLGLQLDAAGHAAHAPVISSDASRVVARVMPTDEDLSIARHTHRLVEEGAVNGHRV